MVVGHFALGLVTAGEHLITKKLLEVGPNHPLQTDSSHNNLLDIDSQ